MRSVKIILRDKYYKFRRDFEIFQLNLYRKRYKSFSFEHKKSLANKWLKQFPEQAHFKYEHIHMWLEVHTPRPTSVLEIGGWRGDLASSALADFNDIKIWHNYDLLENNNYQKCLDSRYQLITIKNDIWNCIPLQEYNALIATHMIEHIDWEELNKLVRWIPPTVESVLFESPLPESDEKINWKGDHSSHILEKGWKQITGLMRSINFEASFKADNTVIFERVKS